MTDDRLAAAGRSVFREEVREALIRAILDGRYKPGDRLTEMSLAREFGVSQAPIREALAHLERMGFVKSEAFKGTYVRRHTSQELRDIYLVRAWLEALAGYLAAPKLTERDHIALAAQVSEMVEQAKVGNASGFYKADYEFHQIVVRTANNSMLTQIFESMQFGYWTFASTILTDTDLNSLAVRHYEVVDALRTGNRDVAADALRKHIEELIESVAAHEMQERKNSV